MKKISFIFLLLIFTINSAFADILPYYTNSLRRYGIGYTQVKSPLVLRQTPDNDGKILETLIFDYNNVVSCQINKSRCEENEVFSAYSTTKKIALLTTMDETQGWSLVCFNQSENPICGWVDDKNNKFYNWLSFMETFGRKYGIYMFKDLQKQDKLLYGAPFKQTNTTGVIQLPRMITPWLVRGNWVLVKVLDLENKPKQGWLNFRGDNGKLKVFVNF